MILVKSHGPCAYYLGKDYKFHDDADVLTYSTKTYTKEALACVEHIFRYLSKSLLCFLLNVIIQKLMTFLYLIQMDIYNFKYSQACSNDQ